MMDHLAVIFQLESKEALCLGQGGHKKKILKAPPGEHGGSRGRSMGAAT